MMTLRLDFKAQCALCGAELHSNVRQTELYMVITPCLACLTKADDSGFQAGYSKGWDEAKQQKEEVLN